MSLSNYTLYTNFAGTAPQLSSGNFTQYEAEVSAAVKTYLRSNVEAAIYGNVTLTAPTADRLVLSQGPVQLDGNLSISLNTQAFGNASLFTSDTLLTQYADYIVLPDADNANQSTSRVVQRLPLGTPWSLDGWTRPAGMLTPKRVPVPGGVLATWRGGYPTVPADITLAVNLAVVLLWQRRTTGYPVTARSIDGISVSYAGPSDAYSVVSSPGVAGLLSTYRAIDRCMGWGV